MAWCSLSHNDSNYVIGCARYGLAPLDIAAQEAWRDAGFEVHLIDGQYQGHRSSP